MTELANLDAVLVLLVGLTTVLAMAVKSLFERVGLPALVGYLAIGFGLRVFDLWVPFLTEGVTRAFELLGSLGLVGLLFSVGLGSHPRRLLEKLPGASLIWVGNVALSGLAGYAAAAYWLELDLVASLVVATALTATSIGVVVPIWQEQRALDSDNGAVTVDVAELDDLSGIVLMALLFAVLPVLAGGNGDFWGVLSGTAVTLLIKLAVFAAACYLFAHYLEAPLTRALARLEPAPARMLTVVGLGSIIAAIAGWLGFSLAIGALFAGLVFSRNPRSVGQDRSYQILYDFLTPYFFIGIGLQIDPTVLGPAAGAGLALLAVAIAGKVLGAGLPALLTSDWRGALLVGVSMVPRAEIAMVIVHQAHQLAPPAVSDATYGAMALVTLGTCLLVPPLLTWMLRRWPQAE